MLAEQHIETIDVGALLPAVARKQTEGYRLVQISCTRMATFELTYSFSKGNRFDHVRLQVADAAIPVPSITDIYFGAFAYENELHDLFGLQITGIKVDYKGTFYKPYIDTPFAVPAPVVTGHPPKAVPHG